MLQGLRVRLLLIAASVAAVAVVATALIAQQVASDDLREALDRDLETQADIILILGDYVAATGTWAGVDEFVDQLADDLDERVALTDTNGRVIADSDPDAPFPSQPVGRIDPWTLFDEILLDDVDDEILDRCDALAFSEALTDDDEFSGFDEDDEFSEFDDFDDVFRDCVEAELGATGIGEVALVYVGTEDADAASILGENGPDARLVVVALLLVLGAIAVMGLALRPVLAPIGDLRSGARRLGEGDLDTRVPETGATEMVELARTFNSMAESLEADDERRRRWTSDVAHELRSPLQNLRGHVEAAQDGLMPTDDEWFDSLVDEVGQLAHLVDDLQVLTLSDSGRLSLQRTPIDIGDLAADVVAAHQARAQQLAIELSSSGHGIAPVDERRIRQVLGNLIDNALRHTPAGGTVTLTIERADDHVEVTVADTGEGIPASALGRVFDRFARVDEHRSRLAGGTGLGLAIVAALVDAHGGRVDVDSVVGQGTSFRVRVPADPAAPA